MRGWFVFSGVSFAVGLVVMFVGMAASSSSLAHARLSLWSNGFFLWPTVRAIFLADIRGVFTYPAAWAEASVFFFTFAASTFHHGCTENLDILNILGAETFALLFVGVITVLTAAAIRAISYTENSEAPVMRGSPWWTVFFLFLTAALVFLVAWSFVSIGENRLDGCAWPHDSADAASYEESIVPGLVAIWGGVDFVTAWSALVIALLFFLQVAPPAKHAVFWAFAVLILTLEWMRRLLPHGAGPDQSAVFVAVFLLGFLFSLCQAVLCCGYTGALRRELWGRYDWVDAGAGALVGVAAIFLFVAENTPTLHAVWHALGALALYSTLEALDRRQSVFFVANHIKESETE